MKVFSGRSAGSLDDETKRVIRLFVQDLLAKQLNTEKEAIEKSVEAAVFAKLQPYLQNIAVLGKAASAASAGQSIDLDSLDAPPLPPVTELESPIAERLVPVEPTAQVAKDRSLLTLFTQALSGSQDSRHTDSPRKPWGQWGWKIIVALAILLSSIAMVRFWFRPPLPQDVATTSPFQEEKFRSNAVAWFTKAINQPGSRVEIESREEITGWLGTLKEGKEALNPEATNQAVSTLLQLVHACWWDSLAIQSGSQEVAPIVGTGAPDIPEEDLTAIWWGTAGSKPRPPPESKPETRLLIVRRWFAEHEPCDLADTRPEVDSEDPVEKWSALIRDQNDRVRGLFNEAQNGGSPPVKVATTSATAFKRWGEIPPEDFTDEDLKNSLGASFEYVHARWFEDNHLSGRPPQVDDDVKAITLDQLSHVRTYLGITQKLPENQTSTDPALQLEVVTAWLAKN